MQQSQFHASIGLDLFQECACVLQAREGIEEADASICLLNVQSQLGLAKKGPMPAQTLAEAALQVASSSSLRLDCKHVSLPLASFTLVTESAKVQHCLPTLRVASLHALKQAQLCRHPERPWWTALQLKPSPAPSI